ERARRNVARAAVSRGQRHQRRHHHMTKTYAGIGSRDTPVAVMQQMGGIASWLASQGYTLRSGGAGGADTAFEMSATKKEIYRPPHVTTEALALAAQFHPAWDRCSDYAKRLHARNGFQVLG